MFISPVSAEEKLEIVEILIANGLVATPKKNVYWPQSCKFKKEMKPVEKLIRQYAKAL